MTNKEAIKYLIAPTATSTKPSAEYLKQEEAYGLAIKALKKPQVTVFAENASKEEIEDFKQELENVLEKSQGECKTCKHCDPEDKKCDCGELERQGCIFPVSDDYYCKYYERGTK